MSDYSKEVTIQKFPKIIHHNCEGCSNEGVCYKLNRLRKLEFEETLDLTFKCETFQPSHKWIQEAINNGQ